MGSVHTLFMDPTSPEGIAGVCEYLHSVFESSVNIQVLHLEPRKWGLTDVADMLAVVTIVQTQIMLRVLYRIVRAEPLALLVWFDDPQHHGRELVVQMCAAPIVDRKPPPSLPFSRR